MGIKKLNYSSLAFPEFQFGFVLPPKITSAKLKNKQLRECLSASVYLASQIELAQGSLYLRVEAVRNVYFRAAIVEMIRTEDITKELGKHFKFIETNDPLLHMMKLLRNYHAHIDTFNLCAGATAVLFREQEVIYESFIASNLSANELSRLESAKGYTINQLEDLVQLYDTHQRKLGVVQLLYNTCLYVSTLLDKHLSSIN
jgi:hypothetical protein